MISLLTSEKYVIEVAISLCEFTNVASCVHGCDLEL